MGVYGSLYQFNFQKFEQELVPKMKNGDFSTAIDTEKQAAYIFENPNILRTNTQSLDTDFLNLRQGLHRTKKKRSLVTAYEAYAEFFEKLVSRTCIDETAEFYIGKQALCRLFKDVSIDFTYANRHSLAFELLGKLDGPCFWTHNSGGYFEGIRGWINPEETVLFLQDLETLQFMDGSKKDRMQEFTGFIEATIKKGYGILNGGDLRS